MASGTFAHGGLHCTLARWAPVGFGDIGDLQLQTNTGVSIQSEENTLRLLGALLKVRGTNIGCINLSLRLHM